ncbi:hypothetical protein M513_05963 [Trichuris suis]|nr:hypothetical protein M513_05963 [Trichuris suis]
MFQEWSLPSIGMIDQNVGQRIIELNVGGEKYQTTLATLTKDSNSVLSRQVLALESPRDSSPPADDTERDSVISCFSSGSYFIDRDGKLFRYVLEYLRNGKLILPESFNEYEALYEEARFFNVDGLLQEIQERIAYRAKSAREMTTIDRSGEFTLCDTLDGRSDGPGHITIGYRGSFTFGRNGQAEVNFRKLNRILVCGRASTCREVFRDTLNESRDPDRGGGNRYTSRMFLKHASLEQAFDMLAEKGFRLIASCASAASYGYSDVARSGTENEEAKWNHYNEFVFFRE